jgi:GT2 family glycosyltransferase
MTVSIIIVNYNGCALTRQCLGSIREHIAGPVEVVVVDNASSDDSRQVLPGLFPNVRFVWLDDNRGFGYANNRGAEHATGDILFFLNNDTILTSDPLGALIDRFAADADCAIAAPKLLNRDGSFQLSFGEFPDIQTEARTRSISRDPAAIRRLEPQQTAPVRKDWVTGAALLIRGTMFRNIGGFDERFFMYFEDSDLCKRVANTGASVWYCPSVSLIHLGGSSYTKKDPRISLEYRKSQILYYQSHHSLIQRMMLFVFLWLKYVPRLADAGERKSAWMILQWTLGRHATTT